MPRVQQLDQAHHPAERTTKSTRAPRPSAMASTERTSSSTSRPRSSREIVERRHMPARAARSACRQRFSIRSALRTCAVLGPRPCHDHRHHAASVALTRHLRQDAIRRSLCAGILERPQSRRAGRHHGRCAGPPFQLRTSRSPAAAEVAEAMAQTSRLSLRPTFVGIPTVALLLTAVFMVGAGIVFALSSAVDSQQRLRTRSRPGHSCAWRGPDRRPGSGARPGWRRAFGATRRRQPTSPSRSRRRSSRTWPGVAPARFHRATARHSIQAPARL